MEGRRRICNASTAASEVNKAEAAELARTSVDVATIATEAGAPKAMMNTTAARALSRTTAMGTWSVLVIRRALEEHASKAVSGPAKYTTPMSELTRSPDAIAPASWLIGKRSNTDAPILRIPMRG